MTERRPKNWLAVVLALQCATLAAVYGLGPTAAPAQAQNRPLGIPDAGAQQQAIIDQLKDVNAKLDRVVSILSGGIEVKPPKAAGDSQTR